MSRPRTFEKSDVLNSAMNLFWNQGYSDTSINDLAEVTNLKPGSLYNTFENKENLFKEALDHYVRTVIRNRLELLEQNEPIDRRIQDFLEDVANQSLQSNRIPGCLLTNSSLEVSGLSRDQHEFLRESLIDLEDVFARKLHEAKEKNELIDKTRPRRLARFLVGLVQGMNVLGRSVPDEQRMEDLIESTMQTIQNHRKDDES